MVKNPFKDFSKLVSHIILGMVGKMGTEYQKICFGHSSFIYFFRALKHFRAFKLHIIFRAFKLHIIF